MSTVLIVVLVVLCVAIVLAIVSHLGIGIAGDRSWRRRIRRHHAARGRGNRLPS